jgi:hypothetical protein
MKTATRSERRATPQRVTPAADSSSVSTQARRQAAAILEVLAGVRRPTEAAQVLETSLPRYYQLERRALLGLLAACEPVPHGRRSNPSRQLATLERENRRLRRECDRQQALVRVTERSLGLVPPAMSKASAKGLEKKPENGAAKRRRQRRPTVRALKMARTLRAEAAAPAAEEAVVVEMTSPAKEGA